MLAPSFVSSFVVERTSEASTKETCGEFQLSDCDQFMAIRISKFVGTLFKASMANLGYPHKAT